MPLISPSEAQAHMLAEVEPLPAEIIPYGASLGRVLREGETMATMVPGKLC